MQRVIPLDQSLVTKVDSHEKLLTQGSFVGDVDKLTASDLSFHATRLVSHSAGSIFCISKNDLRNFLLENPGILLGLSGKMYIR